MGLKDPTWLQDKWVGFATWLEVHWKIFVNKFRK